MERETNAGNASRRTSARRRRVNDVRREELIRDLEVLLLDVGFLSFTMDELARRMKCSKATLYSLSASKDELVLRVTKRFFARAAAEIEESVMAEPDPRQRIETYLAGVGAAMRRLSPAFYADMVDFGPTAQIYRHNSETAARRVRELIEDGAKQNLFRDVNGLFASQVIALAIEAIHSGRLLRASGLSAGDAFAELGDLVLNGLTLAPVENKSTPRSSTRATAGRKGARANRAS